MKLNVDELPWDRVEKVYRVTWPGCNESFPGATFRDGVTVEPVDAITAKRLYQASTSIVVTPWDSSTEVHVDAFSSEAFPVASEETPPQFVADDDDELGEMTQDELRELALDMKLRPHWKAGSAKLRAMIRDARNRA